jgi:hypothetical protein
MLNARQITDQYAQARARGEGFSVVPLEVWHLSALRLQPTQRYVAPMMTSEYGAALIAAGPAFAGVLGGQTVLAAAGLIMQHSGRAQAWALLSEDSGPQFVSIFRAVERFLELQTIRRIDTWAFSEFAPAHRWLRMLGFRPEGRMRCYCEDGSDAELYARITETRN